MKITKIIGRNNNNNTGTTTVIATSDDNDDNDKDKKLTFFEQFSTLMAQDWFRIVVAIVVTPLVYCVIVAILPDAAYWLKHLIALGLSLLFLIFINSALKKSGKDGIGKAIAVGVILLFFFCIACHYLKKDSGVVKDNTENTVDSHETKYSFNPILITDQKVFQLKANEETPWFGFEEGIITNYSISSPSYDYDIVISDGTRYRGGSDVVIPEKKHCYYKVIANSDQFVTVSVKK